MAAFSLLPEVRVVREPKRKKEVNVMGKPQTPLSFI
jgi:hypothetical protein